MAAAVVHTMPEGHKVTQNNRGREMIIPSPLLDEWVAGYDGVHPIADVGAAYGLNCKHAIARGVPVLAVDCAEGHLAYIRARLGPDPLFRGTRYGVLPDGLAEALPDGSVSSILAGEVLHFMRADEMDAALRTLYRALVPGGRLCLTGGHYTGSAPIWSADPAGLIAAVEARAAVGHPWPGADIVTAEEILAREKMANPKADEIPNYTAPHCHLLTQPSMEAGLRRAGFKIIRSVVASHPGYPKAWQNPEDNLQIVAQRE